MADLGTVDLAGEILGLKRPDTASARQQQSFQQPVEVSFENLMYTVMAAPIDAPKKRLPCCSRKKEEKIILNNISGVVSPGQFLTIIGASGSGKTTLLNCLANYKPPSSGTVLANGKQLTARDRHAVAYIPQDDNLLPTATVFDTLNLSAQLRLPRSWSAQRKGDRVEELLKDFRLTKQRETLVGSADEMVRGISGGERKRLSIAVELIAYPSVVFLDEPTSGLDSKIAADVCTILKDLAKGGCTVVATIHQPSSEVFEEFDQLMILSQGHNLYCGSAAGASEYFSSLDSSLQCPPRYNPADFFMKLTYEAADASDKHETGGWNTQRLADEYVTRRGAAVNSKIAAHKASKTEGVRKKDRADRASFCTALCMLCARAGKNVMRDKMLFAARIGQTLGLSLIIMGVYGKLSLTQESIQSRTGVLFFLSVNQMMTSIMSIIMTFPLERAAFVREQRAGMYNAITYFVSKILIELPFQIMFPVIMIGILHAPLGLEGRFHVIATFMVLLNNVGQALGMVIGCSFENKEVAMQVMPLTILPIMIFGGLFVNLSTIPGWLSWVQYISPIRYSYNGMMVEDFGQISALSCTTLQQKPDGSCPYDSGADYLKIASLDLTVSECLWILLLMYGILRVWAYMMLVQITRKTKA